MPIYKTTRLDDGNSWKVTSLHVFVEVGQVLDVLLAKRWVGHDVAGVLEGIADIAIRIKRVVVVGIGQVEIPAIAVVFEGNILRQQSVSNMGHRGWRNGEWSEGIVVIHR